MKPIKDFEGYFVDKDGNIYSLKSKFNTPKKLKLNKMKPQADKHGYLRIILSDKKKYFRFVHRLVAMAYIPNPENKPQVNHINGIKNDNRVINLEWVTAKENTHHAIDKNLVNNQGERNSGCKITYSQAKEIRLDNRTQILIANDYGISRTQVSRIKSFKKWNF
jgi:hypothetical protein